MDDYSKNNLPFVSIVIPCRNEEKTIGKCLDSIIINAYPKEKMEIIVVDGLSQDKTRDIIKAFIKKHPFIKLLDNPKKTAPTAMNIGIRSAQGNIIIRIDAHSWPDKDFIAKSVEYLGKTKADCVGGPIKTIGQGFWGKIIASVLSSPFGVGGSKFRSSQKEEYVHTLPFGAYQREIFDKIGLFDEELTRNQDNDFSYRLRKNGGKIFMTPEIKSYYHCPDGLKKLYEQAFKTGYWNIKMFVRGNKSLSWRHFIPLFFAGGLLFFIIISLFSRWGRIFLAIILLSYLASAALFSIPLSLANKKITYVPLLIFVFFFYHLSYGLGSVWGLIKSLLCRKK